MAHGLTSRSDGGSLHNELLEYLRAYLVGDSLAEGERIPERELCERLGVSRTPMREALKVLASEGLVELLPNRGARVRTLTETDIREVFEVLSGLETVAGELACRNITDEEIAKIERLHFEMYSAYIRQDLPTYFNCNQSIHTAILEASRNRTLVATHASFAARVERVRYHANRNKKRDRWSEAMREHEEILQALVNRSEDDLPKLLGRHLMQKCKSVLEEMAEARPERGAHTA